MLRISWIERRTNEFVRNQIGKLATLLYIGYISRWNDDGIEKIILRGCTAGHRRQGRHKLRWTDRLKQ